MDDRGKKNEDANEQKREINETIEGPPPRALPLDGHQRLYGNHHHLPPAPKNKVERMKCEKQMEIVSFQVSMLTF